jgi:hypothetical protein
LLPERYFLLTEKIKLMIKKGKFDNALKLCQEENYKSFDEIAKQAEELSNGNVVTREFSEQKYKIWESEIHRLKGEVYTLQGKQFSKASNSYLKSIEICKTSKKNWIKFAQACEQFAIEKPADKELWNTQSLLCYFNACYYNLGKSKFYITKIFSLLSPQNQSDSMVDICKDELNKSQCWIWLYWLPQLFSAIQRSPIEKKAFMPMINRLSDLYPQ